MNMGYVEQVKQAYFDFTDAHPEYMVSISDGSSADTILQDMMNRSSDVDIYTGHNAGMQSIGVTWGFRSEALLREAGADYICHTAQELLALLEGMCAEA